MSDLREFPMTQSTRDGGPAFPAKVHTMTDGDGVPHFERMAGMSLRDYFAGQALIGLASGTFADAAHVEAELAYELADAMLAAREKGATHVG